VPSGPRCPRWRWRTRTRRRPGSRRRHRCRTSGRQGGRDIGLVLDVAGDQLDLFAGDADADIVDRHLRRRSRRPPVDVGLQARHIRRHTDLVDVAAVLGRCRQGPRGEKSGADQTTLRFIVSLQGLIVGTKPIKGWSMKEQILDIPTKDGAVETFRLPAGTRRTLSAGPFADGRAGHSRGAVRHGAAARTCGYCVLMPISIPRRQGHQVRAGCPRARQRRTHAHARRAHQR